MPINEQKINENTSLNNSLNFALNSNIGYLSLIMEVLRLLNGAQPSKILGIFIKKIMIIGPFYHVKK